jgi:hypothetical protein
MKRALRAVGLFVWVTGIVVWTLLGANRGWTKTSVQVRRIDPVTEQDIVTWEKRFLPGLEFLAGTVFAGGLLFAFSFFGRSANRQDSV